MQTDVPGITLALCELLAAADVKYLSVAHNYAGRSVPYLNGGQSLRRPFRWRAPSGRRLLVWHTDSPHGIAYMEGNLVGLAESYEQTLEHLPAYLHALATRPYPYGAGTTGWLTGIAAGTELTRAPQEHELLHLRVQSAFADNAAPSAVPAEIVREWNANWTYPRLRMATNRDFFEAAEERLGDAIETYEGDWADWWADGIGSAAREVAVARRAQRGIRTGADAARVGGRARWRERRRLRRRGQPPAATPRAAWPADVERAYEELALFDEHTWGSANPWRDRLEHMDAGALQWRWKAERAYAAGEAVDALLESGRARLAAHVPRPAGALRRRARVQPRRPPAHRRRRAVRPRDARAGHERARGRRRRARRARPVRARAPAARRLPPARAAAALPGARRAGRAASRRYAIVGDRAGVPAAGARRPGRARATPGSTSAAAPSRPSPTSSTPAARSASTSTSTTATPRRPASTTSRAGSAPPGLLAAGRARGRRRRRAGRAHEQRARGARHDPPARTRGATA